MYYFLKKENKIEKYAIDFNREELQRLKVEIINNCSEIEHKEYESTRIPKRDDYLKIRNYKEKKIGKVEGKGYSPDKTLYHFSYDEYEYPYLIILINRLLNGDIDAIYEINNPNIEKEKTSFELRIKEASNKINQIDNLNTQVKIHKLNELQKLIETAKLNEQQKSVYEYYKKVQSLLIIKYESSIDVNILLNIQEFFGVQLNEINDIGENIKKVLKL